MAKVTIKLYGVLRVDSHIDQAEFSVERLRDLFVPLNEEVMKRFNERSKKHEEEYEIAKKQAEEKGRTPRPFKPLVPPDEIKLSDTIIFVNGEKTSNLRKKMQDGDLVWILSPAGGG